ncbi:MAG TPA: SWIM zinc finger family protein, partial [Burkholderiaceae bacterium]
MNAPHEAAKSQFAPSTRDLDRAFHAASLSRGREYALSGRVRSLEVQPQGANSTELRAQVRGSARAPYRVSVTLSRRSAGGPVEIDSRCTCPVGSLCKHAAAVLLRWRPQLAAGGSSPLAAPAPLGRMWIPPAAQADAGPPPLRLDWVEKLRRIGQSADGAADPKRRRLVYRLHTFPYDHRLHVEPRIVYAMKDGRLGRTEAAPADLLRVLTEPAPYVWAADEPLLRALLGLQSHAMVRAFSLEH